MGTRQSSRTVGALEPAVADLIKERGALADGEIVVHFDLVACTRRIVNGEERIGRRHWATIGSDPHYSYGALNAEATRLLRCELT